MSTPSSQSESPVISASSAPSASSGAMAEARTPWQIKPHTPLSEVELSAYQFWKTQSRLAKLGMRLQHSLHQQRQNND